MKHMQKRGFTLIELLVVIAIIGILSSVVVASLNGARQKARDARRVDDIKQLQLALALYADSNGGKYPALLSVLKPAYIPNIPTNPLPAKVSGEDYPGKYALLSGCTSYHLGITLEDPNHVALNSKAGQAAGTAVTSGCAGGNSINSDFDGMGPGVYDVTP